MSKIVQKKTCLPCEGLEGPVSPSAIKLLLKHLPSWVLSPDGKRISREFVCADFNAAFVFLKRIAVIAQKQNHHPDLHLTRYRRLTVELMTHAVGGLSHNDFILAALIDEAWEKLAQVRR